MRVNHQLISKTSQTLTLHLPILLGPTPFTNGGGGGGRAELPQAISKPVAPMNMKFLQGIRDIFESLRNVTVVYIVFTWLP